jgi:hypothetical protein
MHGERIKKKIIIGVRIIKEMPGLVGSGTPCILVGGGGNNGSTVCVNYHMQPNVYCA